MSQIKSMKHRIMVFVIRLREIFTMLVLSIQF